MIDETAVDELLSLWESERAMGRDVAAADLCRDRPELTPELERRIRAVRQMRALVEGQTVTPNGVAADLPSLAETDPFATKPPSPVMPVDSWATRALEPAGSGLHVWPTIPGYEILGELGRGGMGVVYQARQVGFNRLIALKMILAGGHAGAGELARFRTEAEAVARLRHPHVVQVYDIGEHEGRPFFSMEYCPGGLDKTLRGTPLPPADAARLIEMLARAMAAAHARHVIHRDLKPANVLLAEDGSPKITDFGLARKLDEAGQTQTGSVMGTPSYMAPEQAAGDSKHVGPAADVYALGAILYECLTGRPPFKAATAMDTLAQVMRDEPVPPRQLQSDTPRDLETICLKCLRKEPNTRYASAAALAEDLGRWQAGEPIVARPVGRGERTVKWVRRNPVVAALLTAVVVAVVGGSLGIYFKYLDAKVQAEIAHKQAEIANKQTEIAEGKTREAEQRTAERDRAVKELEETLVLAWRRFSGNDATSNAPERAVLPGLQPIIDSGGRLGSCHDLQFTSDGNALLAIGDDKVVRSWAFKDGKLSSDGMQVLRWNIGREQRGAIFAAVLSPDPGNKDVAVAGFGQPTSTIAVIDRATGTILHRTIAVLPNGEQSKTVCSLAYAPDGQSLAFGDSGGGVWTWDFKSPAQRLGKHPRKGDNIVRIVHFIDAGRLVSVAANGTARLWNPGKPDAAPMGLMDFNTEGSDLIRVALSPDGKWFAAAVHKKPVILLRSVDGNQQRTITLKNGEFALSVCFDPRDKDRLAVGVGALVPQPEQKTFQIEADRAIRVYDLSGKEPALAKTLPHTYRAEALTFHPTENYLAVAGGENHEVTLWNLDKTQKPADVIRGAGSGLWGVAISLDGNQIAFQDHRDAASTDPNKRGSGEWRVFDLLKRDWRKADGFAAVGQHNTADGWSIRPDAKDSYRWLAVGPGGEEFELPRNGVAEGTPSCYSFIKAQGKTPTRVAVGHYGGFSLYELNTTTGPKRTRVFAGHQGEVIALAIAADTAWIVSVATDQTTAAWNIGDVFPSHPTLGASFVVRDERLFVNQVDTGSPAWEAGLVVGDEVTGFHFEGEVNWLVGGPRAWCRRLQTPVPGKDHDFVIARVGFKEPIKLSTAVRHRPLWHFYPTRDGEWVMWMWHWFYYDSSTKGDSYLGWHVNGLDLNTKPAYYRAEQIRNILNKPVVLDKLVQTRDVWQALREASDNGIPKPLSFAEFEPIPVSIKCPTTPVNDQDVEVKVTAKANSDNPDDQPKRGELWVNDHRLFEWHNLDGWPRDGNKYSLEVMLPNQKLRSGDNVVTFQTYTHVGNRADISAQIKCTRATRPPRLFGLAVGINDYSAVKGGGGVRGKLGDLSCSRNDAKEMQKAWQSQTTLYNETDMLLLSDGQATRAAILAGLDRLATKVGPDDRCVIYFSGHGLVERVKRDQREPERTTFVFCGYDFDLEKRVESGISSEVLYEKLAAIPGRKLVILDSSHDGEAAVNFSAMLAGRQGPVVLAACDRNQSAYEFPKYEPQLDRPTYIGGGAAAVGAMGARAMPQHGLFTYAILEALGDKFAEADANHNGELDAKEIYNYTLNRMPDLLKRIGEEERRQRPILFAPSGEPFALAKARK